MGFYLNKKINFILEITIALTRMASKKFRSSDLDVNLNGKIIMVTGANSGIGKSASVTLASKGAEIHMVCRSEERANAAKADIIKESDRKRFIAAMEDIRSKIKAAMES